VDSLIAAACQLRAGARPRQAVLQAARSGAGLVVLPAFCLQAAAGAGPAEVFTGNSPSRDELLQEALSIARDARCFLVPGTVVLPVEEEGKGSQGAAFRHVAWLISPDGDLVGEQAQTHTTAQEEASGLVRSDRLEVFPALGVKVGMLVGLDAWVPEVARILTLEGAVVLVAPLAMPAPYSEARQLAGVWQVVQQNQVFGIESCLVGEVGGTLYTGRSAVTAPCEAVPDESGFVVRAPSPEGSLTVMGGMDSGAREETLAAYNVLEGLNIGLYRRVFPMAYLRPGRPGGVGS